MIKVICDVCGKELQHKFIDVVNVNFNSYAVDGAKFQNQEFNLCIPCANKVYDAIRDVIDYPRSENA